MNSKSRIEKEIENKKSIAKVLKLSDKKLWGSLSDDERNAVVDEYYNSSSIEKIGIRRVLDDNRTVRRSIAMLLLSGLLGLSGGIASNVILKYIPSSFFNDMLFLAVFAVMLVFLFYIIDRVSAESLGQDHVLEHLLDIARKNKNNSNL